MSGDKKLIYLLVAIIIGLSIILLIKIKMTPKYNPKIYEEIYDEYEDIFGEEDGIQENESIYTQNIQENNSGTEDSNSQTTVVGTKEPSITEQGNVIGTIIIPKIDINWKLNSQM